MPTSSFLPVPDSPSDDGASVAGSKVAEDGAAALTYDAHGLATEHWTFEEDAYTLGLGALINVKWPQAWPHVLLALLVVCCQSYAFVSINGYICELPLVDGHAFKGVQIVCCLMAAMPLSNEVLEGFRKCVFALRAHGGTYRDVTCRKSMKVGFFLGSAQSIMGCCCFALCTRVIQRAETSMDAFMNYVALGFIADMDNAIVACGVVREYAECTTEFTLPHAPSPACPVGVLSGEVLSCHAAWAVLSTLLLAVIANDAGAAQDPPIEYNILGMLPATAGAGLATTLAIFFGSRRFGPLRVTVVSCLMAHAAYFADFVARRAFALPAHGRPGPLVIMIVLCLAGTSPLAAIAVEYKRPWPCKHMSLLAAAQLVQASFWVLNLTRYGGL